MKKSSTSKNQSKTEIALIESEQRYRTTMMSVGDGVIATDTEGRVEMMNPVSEELTGWKQEEALGKSLEEIFHIINEETRQTVENPVRRVMREGIVVGLANHSVLIAKDGTEHPIADSGAPIHNEKGDITGVVLVFRDQTQERKSQKALRESEEKFHNLVENASIGIVRTKIDGSRVLEANPRMCEILGLTRKEFVGQPSAIAWAHPEQREDLVRLLREKGSVSNYEIDIRTKSGDIRTVIMSMTTYPELGYLEGGLQDITERKRADKALQESELKFRETIKYLDEGYYSCMMDGIVLGHNEAFNRILGIDISKDMKGSKLPDFWLNPDDRKVYLQELMTIGFIRNYIIDAKTVGGEKVVVMVNSHLVKDELGKPVRIEGTFTDFTRLRLTEEALKGSETKYRMLFENAQVGMYRSKIDGSAMLDVNKKFSEILGLTREESLGKAGRILWADTGDRDKMMKLLKEQGGNLYNYEASLLAKNGEVRNVLASIELHPDEGSLDGTMVDITDRKLAEEQLRKLNRIYSFLSDINQAIVRSRVPEELFEKVCDIAVEQGGFGMAWIGLIDEPSQKLRVIAKAGRTNGYHEKIDISLNDKPLSYCPIDSALRQGKHSICKIIENKEMAPCQKIAYDLGFRSSASFPLKVSDIPKGALTFYSDEPDFFDEAELKLLDELALDISFAMEYAEKEAERKRAEEKLREASLYARNLIEASLDPLVTISSEGKIMDVNKATVEVTGVGRSKLIGSDFSDYFTEPEKAKAGYRKVLADRSVINYPLTLRHMSGKTTDVLYNATVYRNEKGATQGVFAAARDITERKRVEDEIRKLNAELEDRVAIRTSQLEATNKELEAFSYSVSHDLRAPLRHVSGYVELLHKHFQSDLPEKGQHYLNSISDSVRIMGMLIDDLLQFSKTGRMEMHQSDCDMNEIVREVIESLNKDNPDRKIDWVVGKLAPVNGDEAMIRLVWMNLLSNAVKFTRTRKKARIEIGVRKENNELVFFVRDNGVGFDMQYAQKLFGVFQRLHPTEEFEGTGIGLANVHRIVLRHGGRTWAKAEPDKGAEFNFSIPNNKEEI